MAKGKQVTIKLAESVADHLESVAIQVERTGQYSKEKREELGPTRIEFRPETIERLIKEERIRLGLETVEPDEEAAK